MLCLIYNPMNGPERKLCEPHPTILGAVIVQAYDTRPGDVCVALPAAEGYVLAGSKDMAPEEAARLSTKISDPEYHRGVLESFASTSMPWPNPSLAEALGVDPAPYLARAAERRASDDAKRRARAAAQEREHAEQDAKAYSDAVASYRAGGMVPFAVLERMATEANVPMPSPATLGSLRRNCSGTSRTSTRWAGKGQPSQGAWRFLASVATAYPASP